MSAILTIPEVLERLSPLTVEEYHRLDEFNEHGRRTELIRGIVIEKMAKSPLHCTLSDRLYKSILPQLPDGYCVWRERPLTLLDSEPEPDISITLGHPDDFKTRHPSTAELVIEVAVSKPALDRENASLYAEAGVKEYWIVLGQKQQIEVYRNPTGGRYEFKRIFSGDDLLESARLPELRIRLRDLFY
jgi:Uma2 family endonuclease